MASLLADPGVKKIVLRRGNALAAYVSQRRALLTGQFLHIKQPDDVSVHIDPDELQRPLTNYEGCCNTYYRLLQEQEYYEVRYDDLCDDSRDTAFKDIANFLGIGTRVPAPLMQTAKQTQASISSHVALAKAFIHTAYNGDRCVSVCRTIVSTPPTSSAMANLDCGRKLGIKRIPARNTWTGTKGGMYWYLSS